MREGFLGKLGWTSGGVLNVIIRARGLVLYFAKREGRNQLDDFPEPFLNQWGANAEAIEACKK